MTHRLLRRIVLAALAAIVVLGVAVPGAQAGSASPSPSPSSQPLTFGLKPTTPEGQEARSVYRFRVNPGDEIVDSVTLFNYAEVPLTLRAYAADGLTNASGTFDVEPLDVEAVGVGSWVELKVPKTSLIVVPARQKVTIPFTLRVPADASPGDHVGGIVVSLSAKSAAEGQNGLIVDSRVAAPVVVRVGGEVSPSVAIENLDARYEGSLWPATPGRITLTYSVRNTGNLVVTADQSVVVDGWLGQRLVAAPDQVTSLLPGDKVDVSVTLPDAWPVGRYVATVSLAPLAPAGELPADPVSASLAFWAIPWTLIVITLLVILGLIIAALRRRKRIPPHSPRHSASADPQEALV